MQTTNSFQWAYHFIFSMNRDMTILPQSFLQTMNSFQWAYHFIFNMNSDMIILPQSLLQTFSFSRVFSKKKKKKKKKEKKKKKKNTHQKTVERHVHVPLTIKAFHGILTWQGSQPVVTWVLCRCNPRLKNGSIWTPARGTASSQSDSGWPAYPQEGHTCHGLPDNSVEQDGAQSGNMNLLQAHLERNTPWAFRGISRVRSYRNDFPDSGIGSCWQELPKPSLVQIAKAREMVDKPQQ